MIVFDTEDDRARVSAAAPELLAALIWAVANMERLNTGGMPEEDPCVIAAKAAIRKAMGRKP